MRSTVLSFPPSVGIACTYQCPSAHTKRQTGRADEHIQNADKQTETVGRINRKRTNDWTDGQKYKTGSRQMG
jgi:hypothetical protein